MTWSSPPGRAAPWTRLTSGGNSRPLAGRRRSESTGHRGNYVTPSYPSCPARAYPSRKSRDWQATPTPEPPKWSTGENCGPYSPPEQRPWTGSSKPHQPLPAADADRVRTLATNRHQPPEETDVEPRQTIRDPASGAPVPGPQARRTPCPTATFRPASKLRGGASRTAGGGSDADHGARSSRCGNLHAYPPIGTAREPLCLSAEVRRTNILSRAVSPVRLPESAGPAGRFTAHAEMSASRRHLLVRQKTYLLAIPICWRFFLARPPEARDPPGQGNSEKR